VFLRFYTVRFPSDILHRQMKEGSKCFFVLFKNIESYFLVSLIKSKTISSIFCFNLSHDVHQFESESLEKCPIEALFYFEQIRSEIQRNFQSTLPNLIPTRLGVSVKILIGFIRFWNWFETLDLKPLSAFVAFYLILFRQRSSHFLQFSRQIE